jgi:predicted dehydrogenase
MKVGILGFAHGHVGSYARQWREHPDLGVELVAGWDHDADRAAKAAADHEVAMCASPAEAIAKCDAVVIGVETSLHADMVEAAAAAGRKIVLQKPMATALSDADRIVEVVAKSGVPFTMAWQMRVDPQNLKIKELLDGGRFGTVFMIRRRHGLSTNKWASFENTWHASPTYNRDIWADDAAHPADFIYWLFGKPQSVTAELASLHNPKVPNDNGVALYRYADGMIAEVSCSFVCSAHENTTEVVCENGTIIQNYGDGVSSNIERPAGGIGLKYFLNEDNAWTTVDVPDGWRQGDRIANLSGPIAEFLHGARPAIATAEEGRDALAMVLACYESSENGRRVAL